MCSNLTSQFVTGSYLYLFPKLRARPCKETRFQKGKDCLRTSNLEGISDICMRIYVYVYIYTNHINILVFSKCRCFQDISHDSFVSQRLFIGHVDIMIWARSRMLPVSNETQLVSRDAMNRRVGRKHQSNQ